MLAPHRGYRSGHKADVVVVTPHALVVVEVKGPVAPVGGTLRASANACWSLPGIDANPVYVRRGDVNPLSQVGEEMYDLKSCAETLRGEDVFVDAIVVVVPFDGLPLVGDPGPWPFGHKLCVSSGELAAAFGEFVHRRSPQWTAAGAAALMRALRADGVTELTLLGEGFPATTPPRRRRPMFGRGHTPPGGDGRFVAARPDRSRRRRPHRSRSAFRPRPRRSRTARLAVVAASAITVVATWSVLDFDWNLSDLGSVTDVQRPDRSESGSGARCFLFESGC